MTQRNRGMKPGEHMRTSLVTVYPENLLDMERDALGEFETRPEFYVVVVRRVDLTWKIEILVAKPLTTGVMPDQVVRRITDLQKRILKDQASQRGSDNMAARRAKQQTEEGN
jgi:hypothetical protein